MKTTLFVLCLFLTAAAFSQTGGHLSPQGMMYPLPDHPGHASFAPIAQEQSVLGGSGYTIAQGDRPASDFPQKPQPALGDTARELRKLHQSAKKASFVWTNQ
jgi:hypothetical protein